MFALPPLPHTASTPAAPMPLHSPGQCFNVDALVCIVLNTSPDMSSTLCVTADYLPIPISTTINKPLRHGTVHATGLIL